MGLLPSLQRLDGTQAVMEHRMSDRPRALDLFCGQGGVTRGLQLAGFHVTGVDLVASKRYIGDVFIQADALEVPLEGYSFVWASPPCQAHSVLKHLQKGKEYPDLIPATRARLVASGIPYCIENVEGAPLGASGYLIMLCGTMFGLTTADGRAELRRHRLFETSFSIPLRPACQHNSVVMGVYGGKTFDRRHQQGTQGPGRKVLTVTGHTPVDNTGGRRADVISVHGDHARNRKRAISVTGNTAQTNVVHNLDREVFTVGEARQAMGIDWMGMKGLSQAIPPAYSHWIGLQVMEVLNNAR
jgi:DNA (cytosine-5)-methyltransferase 1